MNEATSYPIPAGEARVEHVVRRSRFVATLAPAPTIEAAHAFVERIRAEFPDATHNCWAFVAGPPGSTLAIGLSDDGEPHGTAGRPMLEVLLHGDAGEVAAVVTRYFGGVKLGKGGLARAYADAVRAGLDSLPRTRRVERVRLRVVVDYPAVDRLRRALAEHDAVVEAEEFGARAACVAAVPAAEEAALRAAVAALTAGAGEVERA